MCVPGRLALFETRMYSYHPRLLNSIPKQTPTCHVSISTSSYVQPFQECPGSAIRLKLKPTQEAARPPHFVTITGFYIRLPRSFQCYFALLVYAIFPCEHAVYHPVLKNRLEITSYSSSSPASLPALLVQPSSGANYPLHSSPNRPSHWSLESHGNGRDQRATADFLSSKDNQSDKIVALHPPGMPVCHYSGRE